MSINLDMNILSKINILTEKKQLFYLLWKSQSYAALQSTTYLIECSYWNPVEKQSDKRPVQAWGNATCWKKNSPGLKSIFSLFF
jgi:hypothetical protein